ncbi:MAG: restriction endonuclease subunit S [Pyrinomonadaceae bacterium]
MDWKTIELGEVVNFAPKVNLKKGHTYSFVAMEDINSMDRFIYPSRSTEFDGSGGAKFSNGNILFARITPCLENRKIAQVKITSGEYGVGSTEFFVFDAKEGITNLDYLYYLLKTYLVVENAINSMVGASGRQRADWGYVKKLKINLPPLPIQRRIAEVLGRYDTLIENYKRQVNILETSAQMLYREWFVRGRCPYATYEEGSELPVGWRQVKIGEVCVIGRGSSPRPIDDNIYFEDGTIPWIKIADATASGKFLYETKEHVNKYGASFSRFLNEGSLIIATSGTLGFCIMLGVKGCVHDGWLYIPEYREGVTPNFMYFVINALTEYFNNLSYGAAIQNINTDILRETPMTLPTQDVLNKFIEIVTVIDKKIDCLSKQLIELRQMRDKLLPRLMSGQIPLTATE